MGMRKRCRWCSTSLSTESVREEQSGSQSRKLAALRVAAACSYPTGAIEEMIAEIDRGRDLGSGAGPGYRPETRFTSL
jgi:hypothetical protein